MPRKKKESVFPDYVRVRYPDTQVLGILTEKAIGKNRSLTEFAEVCGLSPSTISRIINCKFNNPVSDGVIAAIAKNADPDSGVTLSDLLAVHGLAPIVLVNEGIYQELDTSKPYVKPKLSPSSHSNTPDITDVNKGYSGTVISLNKDILCQAIEKAFMEDSDELSTSVRNIVQTALLDAGYSVRVEKEYNIASISQFRYLADFAIFTDAMSDHGINCWAFVIHSGQRFTLYQKLSWVFGTAYLDSPYNNSIKISVITTDKDDFEEAKEKFNGITIRDCISIILIDRFKKCIIEEYQIKQENVTDYQSVLTQG